MLNEQTSITILFDEALKISLDINIYIFIKNISISILQNKAKIEGVGWMRIGDDVCYYQNWVKRKALAGYLYTLSFSFELPYDNDEVYFCHSFPYTYRDCKDYLDSIWIDSKKIRKTELWKSLSENSLDLVIVTNFESSDYDISKREAVIITSRVHPGETFASFIVEGILNFLVSEAEEAKQLREKYVF